MVNAFNEWLTTPREKQLRQFWQSLGLYDVEVCTLLDPAYSRLITLKQTKLTEDQVLTRLHKLAEIKIREGYSNMEMQLNAEQKAEVQAELVAADETPTFKVGADVIYQGRPLKMPGSNLGFSVMASTHGTITEPAGKGWMVAFAGFDGEVSVPEEDLFLVGAKKAEKVKLKEGDLVKVDMKGEGVVAGFRAGGSVLVSYGSSEGYEPEALVHFIKSREQQHQEQIIALQERIQALELEKAAEIDRNSVYKQRAEQAEMKAQTAPLPSIGEVDLLRQKAAQLERDNTLLKTQLAGATLLAVDEQNPGIQTRTIFQDMMLPERRDTAESELTAMRRAGWEITHIQFAPDLKHRVIMLEIDTKKNSLFDDAIEEALNTPAPAEVATKVQQPAHVVEGVVLGLDDDDDQAEFTFKLEDVKTSAELAQLWRDRVITAAEYQEHSRRIVRETGARTLQNLREQRKQNPSAHPFRVPHIPAEAQS